ncbi:sensor histidine kinase [Kribbella italica]|uniref:histidine kinase n=1 Tax=Kribbella italica TaxID=1540520 RepID=A0A7W9J4H6_9ACTN|nr:histidine kinase [Kribbella italica]MBB5835444.1 signal transduction histidine kinase [Kribbella italica]
MSTELDRPGVVAALFRPGSRAAPGQGRRTPRDWVVDTLFVLLAAGISLLGSEPGPNAKLPAVPEQLNFWLGLVAALTLLLRRRWPVELVVVLTVVSVFVPAVGAASGPALFSVAVHRRPAVSVASLVLAVVSAVVQFWLYPIKVAGVEQNYLFGAGFTALFCMALVAWGIVVRTRRQLLLSMEERARRAESEQELRVEQGRRRERERIAREMHDALGHRLSLLSVHAGALEFRPDMPPDELAVTAGVIRATARESMDDLREIVGVLRGPGLSDPGGRRPQPGIGEIAELVEESEAAGMTVRFEPLAGEADGLPATTGRHGYRIVQEALTNARKHAPGSLVRVELTGGPGDGLTIEVRNRLTPGVAVPGSQVGLVGLAERATLAGGRLEHHVRAGEFQLTAWLPWPA